MIEKLKKLENAIFPKLINYEKINGLLMETRLKLTNIKSRSLGQASRIPGVISANISILMVYLLKNKHK